MASLVPPTRVLAGITVPDTKLIRKALDFVRQNCSDLTHNHVVRSWLFSQLIASRRSPKEQYDAELLAVSTILHDLAWDCGRPAFVSTDKRFEVDSANAGREFLIREAPDWDQRKRQLSWDAIALHTIPSIAHYKETEVAFTAFGIHTDLLGPAMSQGYVTQEEFDEVMKEYPRLNLKDGFLDLMCQLCKSKPEVTIDNFVGEIGEELIDDFSVKEKRRYWDLLIN